MRSSRCAPVRAYCILGGGCVGFVLCEACALRERVFVGGAPFLGICVGMQLLATRGLEHVIRAQRFALLVHGSSQRCD